MDDYSDYNSADFGTVPPASGDNSICMPLLNDTDLSDGRIPVQLGMGSAVLVVSSMFKNATM